MKKQFLHCEACGKEFHAGDTVWFDEEDGCTFVCDDCNQEYDYIESEVLDEKSIQELLDLENSFNEEEDE